ncbi:unnamed protein product [Echinostoma caproni]|uniref:Na_H_Exchanger domain-containing protein n=1 Tax=Echinostoma caproni TaxID=27848 RepID=A0A183ALX6_9TREM|nr:unnamed protein product [Echinostoma caproni]
MKVYNLAIYFSSLYILICLIGSTLSTTGTNETGGEEENPLVERIQAAHWKWHEYSVHITIMLFLMIMVLIKIAFRKIPYIAQYVPESLLLIIIGIIFGGIVRYGIHKGSYEDTLWVLTPTLFFDYLLPPIVLESAYSLYNRTFSEYLGVVLIFAVLGTIFNFLIIGFAMYGLFKAGAFGPTPLHFNLKGFLLFSSLIVAVDPVAVLAIFQDIVVLYDIMSAFAGKDIVSLHEIGVGVASFFTVSLGGFLIGVIVGIISCLITRIKSHLGAFILILLAYFSYIMTDCVGWSGIISMIGCGLIQAAYAFHNLDAKSVSLVHQLTKLAAEICESMIFLYLGIEIVSVKLRWHTGFMLWGLVLCLLARALIVLVVTAIVNAVHVDGTKISLTEQAILIYGGLRGAVAFSLAVLLEHRHFGFQGEYSRRLIITEALFIILFTVGFMGMTMKPLVKLLKIRMQGREPLSLFGVLNSSVTDETMAGLEVITGVKGRNRIRELFMRLDDKYFRHWLIQDPETHDEKMMKVYEKISLKLHDAQIRPDRQKSILADLPDALRQKFLESEYQTQPLLPASWPVEDVADLELGSDDSEMAAAFAKCMRSTRRPTLIPNDKRQMGFGDTLHGVMRARLMSQVRPRGRQPRGTYNEGFASNESE